MTSTLEETMVEDVAEFSDDAQNLIQNMLIKTMGELANTTAKKILRESRGKRELLRHIESVLEQHGLKLRAEEP